jgi:hypothetical protein
MATQQRFKSGFNMHTYWGAQRQWPKSAAASTAAATCCSKGCNISHSTAAATATCRSHRCSSAATLLLKLPAVTHTSSCDALAASTLLANSWAGCLPLPLLLLLLPPLKTRNSDSHHIAFAKQSLLLLLLLLLQHAAGTATQQFIYCYTTSLPPATHTWNSDSRHIAFLKLSQGRS